MTLRLLRRPLLALGMLVLVQPSWLHAAAPSQADVLAAMKRATTFMVEKVAVHGGYVWSYLPDLSRRWGEIEARPQMVWVQAPGTIQMGHVFLDAYHATGDEYYYEAARQVAGALSAGQLACGGWNYLIDFAGEQDLRDWYATTGRNAWRLEEFQHYYGNATFDDSASSDACRYLLRFYLEKKDPAAKAALDRAIAFVLAAQYPNGGWPQRFPAAGEFHPHGLPDYTGYITFNDNVTGGNVDLLIQCYQALGEARWLDPIRRGMDVFLATQGAPPQAGWSLQHSLDLKPAGARSYEPASLATHATAANIQYLLKFHRLTGEAKYLARIPEALDWLESVKLPAEVKAARGATHPTFVAIGTNLPLYIHRRGSNVENGAYYADHDWHNTIAHYSSFRFINVPALRAEYAAAKQLNRDDTVRNSPLLHPHGSDPFPRYFTHRGEAFIDPESGDRPPHHVDIAAEAQRIIGALDRDGRWLTDLRSTSHPYAPTIHRDGKSGDYSRTRVGDERDTSPYRPTEPMLGISTAAFVHNVNTLIAYVTAAN